MGEPSFQIGDVVSHKTTVNFVTPIKMTIHAFTDEGGQMIYEVPGNWVICKWYGSDSTGFRKELFHVNELKKL